MLLQAAVLATLAGQGMCFALLMPRAARCLYTSNETGFEDTIRSVGLPSPEAV